MILSKYKVDCEVWTNTCVCVCVGGGGGGGGVTYT